jgi:hypothetical protein
VQEGVVVGKHGLVLRGEKSDNFYLFIVQLVAYLILVRLGRRTHCRAIGKVQDMNRRFLRLIVSYFDLANAVKNPDAIILKCKDKLLTSDVTTLH